MKIIFMEIILMETPLMGNLLLADALTALTLLTTTFMVITLLTTTLTTSAVLANTRQQCQNFKQHPPANPDASLPKPPPLSPPDLCSQTVPQQSPS